MFVEGICLGAPAARTQDRLGNILIAAAELAKENNELQLAETLVEAAWLAFEEETDDRIVPAIGEPAERHEGCSSYTTV